MDFLQNFTFENLQINAVLVFLILASGFFVKRYWTSKKLNGALKMLIIASVWTIAYLGLTCDFISFEAAKPCLLNGLISYTFATSFYELLIKPLVAKFSNEQSNG